MSYFRCADYNTAAMYNIPISNIDELDTATGIYRGVVKTKGFILLENEPLLFNYNLTFCPAKCVWVSNYYLLQHFHYKYQYEIIYTHRICHLII